MPPDPGPPSVEELLTQSGWLRRLAATLVAGEEAAEDLVQETWLAALRHPPRGHGSPHPWLARIARNLAANFRRAQARRKQHEAEVPPTGPELDPAAVVAEVEAQRVLAEAVLRLEEPLRLAVVLRYSRGLDSRAIGRELGVPAGTVRWRQKHALELLRADLDRRLGDRHAWCSAFAALLRRPGASASPAAPLTGASMKLGATAALGAAAFFALLGAWWIAVGSEPRSAAYPPAESGFELVRVGAAAPELAQPARVDGALQTPRDQLVQPPQLATGSARSAAARLSARARIRGRLFIAGTEEVLDETLTIRLRAGDISVKETVESSADGSFTSKRSFPRGFVLADVLRPAGDPPEECEAFFDPSSDEEWILPVPWPNFVRGRLVDRAGRPLTKVEVTVLQDRNEGERHSWGEAGFSFSGLNRGPCLVTLRHGFDRHEFTTTVRRGANELGDVVVPFRERAGSIAGRLRSEHGDPWGELCLTELASGVTYRVPASPEFEFEEVRLAAYQLTLLSYDGFIYQAPTRVVRPPMTDIEFVAIRESSPFVLRARAGNTELECTPGDPLKLADRDGKVCVKAKAWKLVSGHWCSIFVSCESSDVERWILVSEGHRPASGRALESARIDARLEPGWGCALFFTESSGGQYPEEKGPIAGVEVRADGVPVSRSDGDGVALVSLPREPDRLECGLDGWVVQDHPEGEVQLEEKLSEFLVLVQERNSP